MSTSWKSSSGPGYDTCVTVSDATPRGMVASLRNALGVSRYAELRLDFLAPDDVREVLDASGDLLGRCVCTVRPRSEGGRFRGTEDERMGLLRLVAGYGPYRLDVEYESMRGGGLDLDCDILVSWHDFDGTPDMPDLEGRMREMSGISPHVKIATAARSPGDPARVLSLYGGAGDTELVAFCMGEMGRISRLVCLYLGAPYTYVYLDRPVAQGQYSLADIRELAGLRAIP